MIVESRDTDRYVNATQLCKAGSKRFNDWRRLDTTSELIKEVNRILTTVHMVVKIASLIEASSGRYGGTWIHPDLAVQLAQWISPAVAIQVSRWMQELILTNNPIIHSRKNNEEMKELYRKLEEQDKLLKEKDTIIEGDAKTIKKLESKQLKMEDYVKLGKALAKDQVFYIATTNLYSKQNRYEFGGVKEIKDLKPRINSYNTGRAEGDLIYVAKIYKCNNYKIIEELTHNLLQNYKDKVNGRKEMINLEYSLFIEVVDFICDYYDRGIDFINQNCKRFFDITINTDEGFTPEPINLEDYVEITTSRNGVKKTKRINIKDFTDDEMASIIEKIIELCAGKSLKKEYNFKEQKHTLAVDLTWSLLTPYMKLYDGMDLYMWRNNLRKWYNREKPKLLKIMGVKF